MPDDRRNRLQRYETWTAECEMLARKAVDRTMQNNYERLAMHYRYLAITFGKALALHRNELNKLKLH